MESSKPSNKLDPSIVRLTIAGYEEVSTLTAAERRGRLRRMSEAEARQVFDDLCASHVAMRDQEGETGRLESSRRERKLNLRRALERLARHRRLI